MWFLKNFNELTDEFTISIDFARAMAMMPEQDDVLEPEFELLQLPILSDRTVREPAPELVAPPPSPLAVPIEDVAPSLSTPPASTHHPTRCTTPEPLQHAVQTPCRVNHGILTDGLILRAVSVHGIKWREIARMLGGRASGWSADTVRNRYLRICSFLDIEPAMRHTKEPNSVLGTIHVRWTHREDRMLKQQLLSYGGRVPHNVWPSIARLFTEPGRSVQAVRSRAARLGLGSAFVG